MFVRPIRTAPAARSRDTTGASCTAGGLSPRAFDPAKVRPIATADLHPPRPAPRPANSVLDNAALRLSGIPLLPDWHEPLDRLLKEGPEGVVTPDN